MLKVETFVNKLDGKTLKRIYSDVNHYVLETATQAKYTEAIIPLSRSESEFEETDEEIVDEEAPLEEGDIDA